MICKTEKLNKAFGTHHVIKDFSWEFEDGKMTCISGKSGAGKSTLLNLIGLLEKRDSGELILFDQKIPRNLRNTRKLLKYKIGYLFEDYALLEEKTVEANLKIAVEEHKIINKKEKIAQALDKVGLRDFEQKRVSECSGGEQQRVAIARLLIKPCELILADEPTGSLDQENKMMVFKLLRQMAEEGKTIILVTHDEELKGYCDTVIEL